MSNNTEKFVNCVGIIIVGGLVYFLISAAIRSEKTREEETIKVWSQVDKQINSLQKQVLDLKADAVALGYARYNGTNGNWQWVTNK